MNDDRKQFLAGAFCGYIDSGENVEDIFRIIFMHYDRKEASDICLSIIGTFFDCYDRRVN